MSRSLAAIEKEIRAHGGCGFEPCETAKNPVPGEGNPRAEILFVGEAPGAQEDAQGRPFVGQAGKLFDRLLGEAGLERDDVYITNVLKHRPPGNRNPRKSEVKHEWPWLEAQIEAIEPRLVVPLGRHALDALAPGHKITEDHGRVIVYEGRELYPLFHPSAGLRASDVRALLREDFANLPVQRSATAR
ncbi:MAG: uracil-DNA glycosylase [Solirubrobacteraceae bacterium]|jgi:uracil-DNA glycosylase